MINKRYPILAQPNGVTCGPTCLQSIYTYHHDIISLEDTIAQTEYLPSGGTIAVLLGCHALKRGYRVSMYSFNTYVFDPTWMSCEPSILLQKLQHQFVWNSNPKIKHATQAYIQFLELGGKINFQNLNFNLISELLKNKTPLLSGISATYFYQNMRDFTDDKDRVVYDEFSGETSGHFIVIYDADENENLSIADPYLPHTLSHEHHYIIPYNHWLHALLLGSVTYDAEVLVIEPVK